MQSPSLKINMKEKRCKECGNSSKFITLLPSKYEGKFICENCKSSEESELNIAAKQLGKLGGQATVEKHGREHFKKIAKGWPKGKKRKKVALVEM